jgi:hypothetical protein
VNEPPSRISEADWLSTPASVRTLILSQQEEIDQLRAQLTALGTELASLRERIGRNWRNSSHRPSMTSRVTAGRKTCGLQAARAA